MLLNRSSPLPTHRSHSAVPDLDRCNQKRFDFPTSYSPVFERPALIVFESAGTEFKRANLLGTKECQLDLHGDEVQ